MKTLYITRTNGPAHSPAKLSSNYPGVLSRYTCGQSTRQISSGSQTIIISSTAVAVSCVLPFPGNLIELHNLSVPLAEDKPKPKYLIHVIANYIVGRFTTSPKTQKVLVKSYHFPECKLEDSFSGFGPGRGGTFCPRSRCF